MAIFLLNRAIKSIPISQKYFIPSASIHYRDKIGKREIVGFGYNGQPSYADRSDFPMPAIRWQEPSPEIEALQKKEKEDWKKLTKEEKKCLYRYSFCQTYAEFRAPTGEWKGVIGSVLLLITPAFWVFYWIKVAIAPPLPITFQEEYRRAQFRRLLDIENGPITGVASRWDYEKDDWKNGHY